MSSAIIDFDLEEYQGRLSRFQRLLGDAGIGGVIISSEANHRYFTGHASDRWFNWSRPIFSVIPTAGWPIMVVNSTERSTAERTSWLTDIRTYRGLTHDIGPAIDLLHDVLVEKGLTKGGLGFELGLAHRLGMPLKDYVDLTSRLPNVVPKDATSQIWQMRMSKSAVELARMQEATRITDEAIRAARAHINEGSREIDIKRWFEDFALRNRARPGIIIVRAKLQAALTFPSGEASITPGDLVYVDTGCIVHGYWSDYNRYFNVGKVDTTLLGARERMWDLTEGIFPAIRAGNTIGDLYAAYEKGLAHCGIPHQPAPLGRIGHGIGLDQMEHPSIAEKDKTVLVPGMTLCIEPNAAIPDVGLMIMEEEIVVTETGYRLLNERAPRSLN